MAVSAPPRRPRPAPGQKAGRPRPTRATGLSWLPVSRRRIAFLRVAGSLMALVLVVRLVQVTVFPGANYRSLASQEGYSLVSMTPERGSVLDSAGQVLAASVPRSTVVVDPLMIQNPIAEAARLSDILGIPKATIRSEMLAQGQYVYVDHQISNSLAGKVRAALGQLPGVYLVNEPATVRPNGAMAASVIGNVSLWGQGQGGIEQELNSVMTGKPGKELLSYDPSGSTLPGGTKVLDAPVQGSNVTLTLDSALQLRTEEALSNEMVASQARAGVAIITNYKTGKVLAMANLVAGAPPNSNQLSGAVPTDQPQPHFSYTQQAPVNMAVDYVYEPGSVAKIATFAAALRAGVITPGSELVVPDQIYLDGTRFHDAETHAPEILSPQQILEQSSNVGTIMIASKLSPQAIDASFRNFGWGVPTGLNLPGESPGFLDPPSHWSGTAPGSVPIGQDEAVTPMQVLDSYNSIANGGVLVTPRLVSRIGAKPTPISTRRVLPASVASVMTGLLSKVTDANGTAPAAAVPGFAISGKTGTASVPYGGGRPGYVPGGYMATFVGFSTNSSVPLSAIVVLTEPQQLYGGLTSAKVFSQIMSYALYHTGAHVVATTPTAGTVSLTPTAVASHPSTFAGCRIFPHRFGASVLGTNCPAAARLTSSSLLGAG